MNWNLLHSIYQTMRHLDPSHEWALTWAMMWEQYLENNDHCLVVDLLKT